ncbi:MAG: hypothetical protein AB7E52_05120 [Bdellovibrionales bacterium]
MGTLIRRSAYIANLLLLALALLFISPEMYLSDWKDLATAILILASPILSIAALWNFPDGEERKLRRRLAKAELRHKLKQLGEEA